MGNARSVTASNLRDRINFELRNTHQAQFTEPEILSYINKWLEFTHQFLIESNSDLVRTGTGQITTVENTETYSLSVNDMGDLWVPYKVWAETHQPMDMVSEHDRDSFVASSESGVEATETPYSYYIEGDNIGFLPFPDGVYTIQLKYYPEFTPLPDIDTVIPYRNLFNLQLEEGAKILAKNRENYGTSVDGAIMEVFKERAKAVMDLRQKRTEQLTPMIGGYCG